ncbi:hypothetical protein EDD92_0948 [Streptomyces sp. TLI_185]|nr:hypothetical protein EDD92_0948 [Streptomyces sp. TLI_185]
MRSKVNLDHRNPSGERNVWNLCSRFEDGSNESVTACGCVPTEDVPCDLCCRAHPGSARPILLGGQGVVVTGGGQPTPPGKRNLAAPFTQADAEARKRRLPGPRGSQESFSVWTEVMEVGDVAGGRLARSAQLPGTRRLRHGATVGALSRRSLRTGAHDGPGRAGRQRRPVPGRQLASGPYAVGVTATGRAPGADAGTRLGARPNGSGHRGPRHRRFSMTFACRSVPASSMRRRGSAADFLERSFTLE